MTFSASQGTVTKDGSTWNWTYLGQDDEPLHPVTITAHDGQGGTATFVFDLQVKNVEPVIESLVSGSTEENHVRQGQPMTLTATFSDVGLLDTHTATINWGDGGQPEVGSVSEVIGSGQGTSSGRTPYAFGGIYTVTVTLSDDNGGVVGQSTTTVIAGAGLHNGQLQLIGTDELDIFVAYSFAGQITVHSVLELAWQQSDDDWDENENISQNWASYGIDYSRLDVSDADVQSILVRTFDGHDVAIALFGITKFMNADGGAGNDWMVAGSGNDTVNDLVGNNRLYTGSGNDSVTTGPGNDRIWTDGGDDVVNAGDGNNEIHTDGGNDNVTTGAGSDDIYTGTGDDTVVDAGGNNDIYTDGGNDYVTTGGGADHIEAGAGNDRVYAGGGNDWLSGGDGHDILVGGSGNDTLTGNTGRDLLIGGAGADTVEGSSDEDIMIAGWTWHDSNDAALVQHLARVDSHRHQRSRPAPTISRG